MQVLEEELARTTDALHVCRETCDGLGQTCDALTNSLMNSSQGLEERLLGAQQAMERRCGELGQTCEALTSQVQGLVERAAEGVKGEDAGQHYSGAQDGPASCDLGQVCQY